MRVNPIGYVILIVKGWALAIPNKHYYNSALNKPNPRNKWRGKIAELNVSSVIAEAYVSGYNAYNKAKEAERKHEEEMDKLFLQGKIWTGISF